MLSVMACRTVRAAWVGPARRRRSTCRPRLPAGAVSLRRRAGGDAVFQGECREIHSTGSVRGGVEISLRLNPSRQVARHHTRWEACDGWGRA